MSIKLLTTSPRTLALGVACCLLGACSGQTPDNHPAWGVGVKGDAGNAGAGGAAVSAGTGGATLGAGGAVAGAAGASAGASDVGGATGGGGAGGTGGGTAGSGGTAGNAGTGGTGGAGTNCNGAALCDSFERTTLGPDWTLDNSTSSTVIELVTTQAHSGMSSVHIKFGTTTLQSYITHKLPTTGNSYWGRAWIYSSFTPVGHSIYIEARVAGGGDKSGVRSLNTFDAKGTMGLNLESNDNSKNSPGVTMSQMKWVCYEWQVTGIGGSGDFTTWVDGVPEPPGKVTNGVTATTPLTGTIPALTRERIGIQRYDAGAAGEMWIDDVAIGDTRINCTP